jgi:hypothetical protein
MPFPNAISLHQFLCGACSSVQQSSSTFGVDWLLESHFCFAGVIASPSSDAPGVGGWAPSTALPSFVCGRDTLLNSGARVLIAPFSALVGVKVSCPITGRGRGLDLPFDGEDDLPLVEDEVVRAEGLRPAFFSRSSVALSRASSAWSSEVWLETAFFFSDTAASRSAILLSILKRSLRARENERAMVDWGLPFGFHSLSISSSDMLQEDGMREKNNTVQGVG